MIFPKQSKTIHVEMLNDELCLYDWQRKEVHALNPTAATVWQLCDGQTSPQQMAGQLKGDLNAEQAEALVWASLEQLREAHLLESEIARPDGRPILTRRQALKVLGGAAAGAALLPVVSSIVAPTPVEAQSPVLGTGDLQVTITWDAPGDVDLHTVEPTGETVYYSSPSGPTATLDFDSGNVGPENIFVATGGAAAGTYQVYIVNYSHPSSTTVTIVIRTFVGTASETSQTFTRTLNPPANSNVGINVADITYPAGTVVETTGTRTPVP
ncbi:MAG: PqqD family peptide modification chaperone [Chloroflexota bacterium]